MLHSAFPVYPLLETMMREAGAHFVSITGSGSCLYGVFGTMAEASAAKEKLDASLRTLNATKTLYGMALHAMKPLETSLLLG
jgi:4-diphosphocytidyl-2C-methyl-D-erythritol kinase